MAKHHSETKVKSCEVKPDASVTAKVTIGQGQVGGWAIKLGSKLKQKGAEPAEVVLGIGDKLDGTYVRVDGVMMDVRPETDRLSLKTRVFADGEPVLTVTHRTDGGAGDSAHYTTLIYVIAGEQ